MKSVRACLLSVAGLELTLFEKQVLKKANPLGVTLFKRNIQSLKQVKALTQSIKEVIGRENVLIATDQEGGRVCRFESNETSFLAQRAIGSMAPDQAAEAAKLQAYLMSDLLLKAGVNVNFAPCLDVLTPETAPVLKSRCFSDNEQTVADLGEIFIKTYLQKGILPCMKHLPGHGRTTADPHLRLPVMTANTQMLQKDFYPFRKLADLCPMGMTAHIVVSAVDETAPATQSAKVIRKIIREDIGFHGFLVSDALEMKALSGRLGEKTQKALSAGCDAVCYCLGEEAGLAEMAAETPFLTDEAAQRFLSMCSVFKRVPVETPQGALAAYQKLVALAPVMSDDYDAVEVLHQLKKV